jgi:hypothetical protein
VDLKLASLIHLCIFASQVRCRRLQTAFVLVHSPNSLVLVHPSNNLCPPVLRVSPHVGAFRRPGMNHEAPQSLRSVSVGADSSFISSASPSPLYHCPEIMSWSSLNINDLVAPGVANASLSLEVMAVTTAYKMALNASKSCLEAAGMRGEQRDNG